MCGDSEQRLSVQYIACAFTFTNAVHALQCPSQQHTWQTSFYILMRCDCPVTKHFVSAGRKACLFIL